MARTRAAAVMVAGTTAMAATGGALAYVYFTGPPHPPPLDPSPAPPQPAPLTTHLYRPPPDLPLSSKLPIIPDANFEELERQDAALCDYGPLWECIVNGYGGCEVLEEDLRECLERCRAATAPSRRP